MTMENQTEIPLEDHFIRAFDRKIISYVRLNVLFVFTILIELVLFVVFIPIFIKSALLAFMVALFFLTIFSFFIFRQYLDSQKLSYFETLLGDFIVLLNETDPKACRQIEIARDCTRIAHRLYQKEYKYYSPPHICSFAAPFCERISAWLHWEDVHLMRELLLQKAVDEQIQLVRFEPTNPDAHALLANAYVMLSGLYVDPCSLEYKENERWIPTGKYGEKMCGLFEESAKKAVEEFKILKEYAPNDPWIYLQLAYSYRDLQMHEEEKEAYKSILQLRPQDHETRFNLGLLYFKQGENARGLKVFEELKKANYNKADELLCIYGQRNLYG